MAKQAFLHPALRFHGLRLRIVAPIKGTTKLYAEWENGEEAVVEFKESIQRAKGFQPLADPKIFEKVHLGSWGCCIEWTDEIDFGSDTLRLMASEQGTVVTRKKSA